VTINLATGVLNQVLVIKDERGTASADQIMIVPEVGETVDGLSSTNVSTDYGSLTVWFNTRWNVIGRA
jgi:hypothetical protein